MIAYMIFSPAGEFVCMSKTPWPNWYTSRPVLVSDQAEYIG